MSFASFPGFSGLRFAPPENDSEKCESSRAGNEERRRLLELLDGAQARSVTLRFWWRDDDAVDVTPELEQLIGLSRRHDLPLALAVIPKPATEALARCISAEPQLRVLQHGWEHRRHSPETEKKAELGDHRPLPEILGELSEGFERLTSLFSARFLPVLAPPWNRIGERVKAARSCVGLQGLSMFGRKPSDEPHWVNAHVDLIDWATRRPRLRGETYRLLGEVVASRLGGDPEPIGILTHHLMHRTGSWEVLEEILDLLRPHPAVSWPLADLLFQLPARHRSHDQDRDFRRD